MVNSTNYDDNDVCKSTFATKHFYGSETIKMSLQNWTLVAGLHGEQFLPQPLLTYYHHQENRIG